MSSSVLASMVSEPLSRCASAAVSTGLTGRGSAAAHCSPSVGLEAEKGRRTRGERSEDVFQDRYRGRADGSDAVVGPVVVHVAGVHGAAARAKVDARDEGDRQQG